MDGRSANSTETPDLTALQWENDVQNKHFLISTSRQLIDEDFVNDALDSQDMPWAIRLTSVQLKKMLDHSLTLGLYEEVAAPADSPNGHSARSTTQIGMARLIGDHITFAYLTDVYIQPAYRRFGLARWLMACCRGVFESMPAIRRGFLVTSLPYGAEFYKETLGFHNVVEDADHLIALTGKFGKT